MKDLIRKFKLLLFSKKGMYMVSAILLLSLLLNDAFLTFVALVMWLYYLYHASRSESIYGSKRLYRVLFVGVFFITVLYVILLLLT